MLCPRPFFMSSCLLFDLLIYLHCTSIAEYHSSTYFSASILHFVLTYWFLFKHLHKKTSVLQVCPADNHCRRTHGILLWIVDSCIYSTGNCEAVPHYWNVLKLLILSLSLSVSPVSQFQSQSLYFYSALCH